MTTLLTSELIDRIHSAAKAKGFWDATPNAGQFLMLTIGELGECQEAHRKGIVADVPLYNVCLEKVHHLAPQFWPEGEARAFKECIKDSVEDELADAYIRLCDIAGGFQADMGVLFSAKCDPRSWKVAENFGEALLTITSTICDIKNNANGTLEGGVADALTLIESLALQQNIDLAKHVELKLAYNLSRPVRHGKSY